MRWYTAIAYSTGAAIGAGFGFLWPVLGGAMILAGYGAWAWSAYILMPIFGAVLGGVALALAVNILVESTKLIIRGICALISWLWNIDYQPPGYISDPGSEYVGGVLDIDWGELGEKISHGCQEAWEGTRYRCHQFANFCGQTCHNIKERVHGPRYQYEDSADRERQEAAAMRRNTPKNQL